MEKITLRKVTLLLVMVQEVSLTSELIEPQYQL